MPFIGGSIPRSKISLLPFLFIVFMATMTWGCQEKRDRRAPSGPCMGDVCDDYDVGDNTDAGEDAACDPALEACEPLPPSGAGCATDAQCPQDRYCSDGACVTEQYICTLLGCNATRGVCDPSARACVNAETCLSQSDCLEDYLCVDASCQTLEQACSVCAENEQCTYVPASNTIACEDPNAPCTVGRTRCADASTSEVCSESSGEFESQDCAGLGCNMDTGLCNRRAGDGCLDAIDATNGYNGSIQWNTFTNDYGLQPDSSCVEGDALFNTFGSDVAYFVDLPAGDTVFATLTTPGNHGSLYLVTDCSDLEGTCLDASPNLTQQGGNHLLSIAYENEGAETRRLYLIADSGFGAETRTAQIEIGTGTLICAPGTVRCNGDDLEVCSATGLSYETTASCPFGCDSGAGRCNLATNDNCAGAYDIMASGGTFTGNVADYTATYSGAGACPGTSAGGNGRDALFFVDLNVGDRVTASMFSTYDGVLWAMTDCASPGPSCVAGRDATGSNGTETITFIAAQAGRHYLVADAYFTSSTTGTFTLTVRVDEPLCANPGANLGCQGNAIEVCGVDGFSTTLYECPTTCNAGRCEVPGGDVCHDAIDIIAAGGTFSGNLSDFTSAHSPRGSCPGSSISNTGRDAVFFVDVNAGERVTARMQSSYDGLIWVMTDCDAPGASCLALRNAVGTNNTETLAFIAETTGRYYLVADALSTSIESGTFFFTATVEAPTCFTPGDILGCTDPNTLAYCVNEGFPTLYTCLTTCTDDMCDQARGDICYDAIELTPGSTYSSSFSEYTNTFNPGTSTCITGSNNSQVGRDAVFAIHLEAGQILEADLTTSASSAGMYILDACTSVTDISEACLYATPRAKFLEFYASKTQLYYLVVDAAVSNLSTPFSLDVDVRAGACQPDVGSCEENVLTLCNADGSEVLGTATCAHGCGSASCAGPEIANDTCPLAYDIDGSVRIQDTFDRFRDEYNLQADGCVGLRTPGKEAVYRVSMKAGEALRTRLRLGTTQTSHVVYIVSSCASLTDSCISGGRSVSGVASAAYVATQDETVFVIVDATSSTNSGTFILDIEMSPTECFPSEGSVCEDADTVRTCLDTGLYERTACVFGCESGQCLAPENDTCAGALDATQGLSFTSNIEHYSNTYQTASPSCTNHTANGPDSVYFVDAKAGDVIRIVYTAPWDNSLWITTDCSDAGPQCVAGVDAGGLTETLTYTATETRRYYIIADSWTTSPAPAEFTVDITINP